MTSEREKSVAPRAAATVMVVRPVRENLPDGAYQVFMVRRSAKSPFVPDMFVFPGGSLDTTDASLYALNHLAGVTTEKIQKEWRNTPGVGADQAVMTLSPAQQAGLYLAALRELFEEAGVLLAKDEKGEEFEVGMNSQRRAYFATARQAMQKNELSFIEMLEKAKLKADGGRLLLFSHWITPYSEHRRFDTRFFLAATNYGQEAEADKYETTEGVWIEPANALAMHSRKEFNLIYPTIAHLQRLAAHPTIPDLLNYARTKEIVPAMPDSLPGPIFKLPDQVVERW